MQAVQQQGQQAPQEPLRRRIAHFLARTIDRFRIVFLVILIAAATFLVGYFIYGEIVKKVVRDSTALAESVQTRFDSWQAESDAAKKTALEKDLLDQMGTLISRYPRQFGGQRGLFMRAEVNYSKKAWDEALKDYTTLAERFPKSYLAPICLFNAGVCAEEKGDTSAALALYVRAFQGYKDSTITPRAMFDAGRLYEATKDWAAAQKTYESIDTAFGQSIWNKLAKNRIIDLKVQGRIK
jgi:TolA-binding protein